MKTITYKQQKLSTCIGEAQRERVPIARDRKPVLPIVGLEAMEEE